MSKGFLSIGWAIALAMFLVACGGGDEGGNPVTPTADLDGDGITGSLDQCPNQAENRNNVFDRDGCPDQPTDLYFAVRADAEAFWTTYFNGTLRRSYFPANVRMFSSPIFTACGPTAGPFYCGLDFTIYLDEPFMADQLSRIGDFAAAIIVAHEIGHHTQNLLGLLGQVSIAKELQADCLAGGWAASAGARGLLDAGDFQEAARSLFEAGDRAGTPWFSPAAHGTSLQRQQAFSSGFLRGATSCG